MKINKHQEMLKDLLDTCRESLIVMVSLYQFAESQGEARKRDQAALIMLEQAITKAEGLTDQETADEAALRG